MGRETFEQLQTLKSYLEISSPPDDSWEKAEGSCTWIHNREDFNTWKDAPNNIDDPANPAPTLHWIHAGPGSGKTVLASHVVSHLKDRRFECAYYHFRFRNKNAQTLGGFLRSLAFQMARSNAAVRERLILSYRDGLTFDHDDTRTIWARMFKRVIFQVRCSFPLCFLPLIRDIQQPQRMTSIASRQDRRSLIHRLTIQY